MFSSHRWKLFVWRANVRASSHQFFVAAVVVRSPPLVGLGAHRFATEGHHSKGLQYSGSVGSRVRIICGLVSTVLICSA